MIDLKAALSKARGNGRNATPRGRAIVEVHGFDEKAETATGKIIDGQGAGEMITFELSGRLKAADYLNKPKTKVELADGDKPGGTLQVEGLTKADGKEVYKTRWIKTFQSKPSDNQDLLSGQTFTLKELNRKDANGIGVANIEILDMAGETHAKTVDDLRKAFIDAVDKDGAVTLMTVTEAGEPITQAYYGKAVKQEDGTYVRESGESRLAELDKRLEESVHQTFADIFAPVLEGAGVSVLPTRSIRIGSGTWEAVEEKVAEMGRGGPVDPASFKFASLSGRFAGAVSRMDVDADRKAVIKAFLDEANEDAKAKFNAKGFGAVEDRDIQAFLAKRDISLLEVPSDGKGYINGSLLTLPFNMEAPERGVMITKSFNVTAATPFPNVKAFEEVRARYYGEMNDAVKVVAELALGGPKADDGAKGGSGEPASKTSEAKAPEAKADAIKETVAASIDEDDIDDLLSSIADNPLEEPMNP